ncbi:unnamed protein product [[Candida] boidinii]|uniref:Unnamed protein product n=1 Tax=Candida boidinii TaxID=5477 RepID=A0A9W6T625_CANBO|nr:hypothetical protein B5S30_g2601 [[Candida] boidinii]GME74086.1 unnamed protein product [[Candida] boidinii]GMF50267.1 unnamed protein product [[Candida] boidinii]GMG12019.1 unnamed protein product [[Candida] boidinii]
MENYILVGIIVILITIVLKNSVLTSETSSDPLEIEIDPSKHKHNKNSNNMSEIGEKIREGEPIVEKMFTPRTLYKYNGFDLEQIYIAVKGNVYDVSSARQFYGPSGPYSNFAGHDASRGLALNSFEENVIRGIDDPLDDLSDLTKGEKSSLEGWEEMFQGKYPKVGVLVADTGKNDDNKEDLKIF